MHIFIDFIHLPVSIPDATPESGQYSWSAPDGTKTTLLYTEFGNGHYEVQQNTIESDGTTSSLLQTVQPPIVHTRTRVSGRSSEITFSRIDNFLHLV